MTALLPVLTGGGPDGLIAQTILHAGPPSLLEDIDAFERADTKAVHIVAHDVGPDAFDPLSLHWALGRADAVLIAHPLVGDDLREFTEHARRLSAPPVFLTVLHVTSPFARVWTDRAASLVSPGASITLLRPGCGQGSSFRSKAAPLKIAALSESRGRQTAPEKTRVTNNAHASAVPLAAMLIVRPGIVVRPEQFSCTRIGPVNRREQ